MIGETWTWTRILYGDSLCQYLYGDIVRISIRGYFMENRGYFIYPHILNLGIVYGNILRGYSADIGNILWEILKG